MHIVAQVLGYNICLGTREIPDLLTAEGSENMASIDMNDLETEDQFGAGFRQKMNNNEPLRYNYYQLEDQDQKLCQSLLDTLRAFKASLNLRSST